MFELLMKRVNRLLFGDVQHRIRKLEASVALVERKIRSRTGRR